MFARTARLTLRPAWREDVVALAHAIAHDDVATRLGHAPWPDSLADAEMCLDTTGGKGEAARLIFAHEHGTPRLIGGIGIHREVDGLEFSYWLIPDARGRGYATEAGHAMLGMARYGLGLRRLGAGHFLDDQVSGRVLRKLGFRPTGRTELRRCRARGTVVATAMYALDLADDDCDDGRMAA